MTARRIVSLLPSASEIVCALGLREQLVGRSHECDFPAGIEALPICSRPRAAMDGDSRSIDRGVRELVRDGLSVYEVIEERLAALSPDLIVTQAQCEVCAVTLTEVERAVADWVGSGPELVSLVPERLDDVWEDVVRVGAAAGVPDRAGSVAAALRARVESIARRATERSSRPRVACIEWIDPLMAAGNWVPELVGLAGGQNLFGEVGQHSPWLTWEDLSAADPDIIVIMPCGFDLERTRREAASLATLSGWQSLRAVREGRVMTTDGHRYFNRPGPRLVESLEILVEIFRPESGPRRHEGTGWCHYARSGATGC